MERYFLEKKDLYDIGYEIILEPDLYEDYIVAYDPYHHLVGVYHKYPKVWELEKTYPCDKELNKDFGQEILNSYFKYLNYE